MTDFWTPRKMIQLRVLSRKKSHEQLAEHYKRPITEIIQVLRFEAESRRLKLEKEKVKIGKKKVTVTRYAAEYALGAKSGNVVWLKNSWF